MLFHQMNKLNIENKIVFILNMWKKWEKSNNEDISKAIKMAQAIKES